MDILIDFFIGCLAVIPVAQSYAAFWPIVGILTACSLVIIVFTKQRTYGSRWMWAGLGILAIVACIDHSSWRDLALLPIYAIVFLAGLQIRSERVSKLFSFLLIPQVIAVIALNFVWPDRGNGGIIAPGDYNVPSALMMIAFLLSCNKWQWILLPFVIIGLYMTSGEEALILIGVLALCVIVRRDFSRRIWPSVAAVLICGTLYLGFHLPNYLYMVSQDQLAMLQHEPQPYATETTDDLLRGRSGGYSIALDDISALGHGMDTWNIKTTSIHNIPLRLLYELGIIGLLGFLLVLIRWATKANIYIAVILIAMMLFDHYLWTLIGVWLWAILGLTYNTTNTYIFRDS